MGQVNSVMSGDLERGWRKCRFNIWRPCLGHCHIMWGGTDPKSIQSNDHQKKDSGGKNSSHVELFDRYEIFWMQVAADHQKERSDLDFRYTAQKQALWPPESAPTSNYPIQ